MSICMPGLQCSFRKIQYSWDKHKIRKGHSFEFVEGDPLADLIIWKDLFWLYEGRRMSPFLNGISISYHEVILGLKNYSGHFW